MKLRRVSIENVRSFLDKQEFKIDGDISIIIGPNGGGKTNLLDTAVLALRLFLLKSWVPRHNPTAEWQDRYDWINNDALTQHLLEKHSAGQSKDQCIELDLELTQTDINNIIKTKTDAQLIREKAKSRYANFPVQGAESWVTDNLQAGAIYTYKIVNGSLQPCTQPGADTFRRYLESYEIDTRLRAEYDQSQLATPMISLPVNRSAGTVAASVSLADFNEHDYKKTVDAASSRAGGSITSLAIGRLALRFRELIEKDDGKAREDFYDDPAIKSFSETLKSLGYDWELKCTNTRRNQYDIQLKKQGSSFRVGAASSGERELLTYLFAIYALNVRDALIVIDEPELHLHPRWQRNLLSMFERLASETGNQFIMATHSPVFVSPLSIRYVSRVYSETQQSRVVKLGDSGLPDPKHLFSIINSQNNERVFFADLVILVEGISDRIFFEALLRHFNVFESTGKVYEVVSVGGKSIFTQYEKLLIASHVPYAIIADLDYLKEIGSDAIKSLFSISAQNIKQKVIDDPTSMDAASLVARLDEAIATADLRDLAVLWEYIKARQTRLRTDLNDAEKKVLQGFIIGLQSKNTYVLSRGSLESYLPAGHKNKDLEKLIRLVSSPDLWEKLPVDAKTELETIVTKISSIL